MKVYEAINLVSSNNRGCQKSGVVEKWVFQAIVDWEEVCAQQAIIWVDELRVSNGLESWSGITDSGGSQTGFIDSTEMFKLGLGNCKVNKL